MLRTGEKPYRCVNLLRVCLAVIWLSSFPSGLLGQGRLRASYEAAQALFQRGDDERAETAFQALLAETYRARGALYAQQGEWARAKDDLGTACGLRPKDQALRYELAYAYFQLENYSEAVTRLESLVRERPGDAQAHGLLGRAYLSLGKLAEARRELNSALGLTPDDPLTAYTLALAALQQKDREGADRILAGLKEHQQSPAYFHLLVGRAYLDTGYHPEAQRELRQALRTWPNLRFAHYLLALSILREREVVALSPAKEELTKELELYPNEFAARYLLGLLLEFNRSWEPAAEAFRRAVILSPNDPDPYFHLGNVHRKQGRPREAIEELRHAQALVALGHRSQLEVSRAHYLLSQAYRASGDVKSSAQEVELARQASVESTRHPQGGGMGAGARGGLEEFSAPTQTISWQGISPPAGLSIEQTQLLRVYEQVLARGHNYLGLIAARQRRFSDAAQDFTRVSKLQANYPDVDLNLGLALFNAERYSEALEPLERAVARNPSNLTAKKYLGLTYVHHEVYDKAARLLEEVRAASSDDPRVLLGLGTALARLNRPDEARAVFVELMKLYPDSAPLHVLWGQVHAARKQTQEAEQEFQRALELDPSAASAHFYLGILKLQQGQLNEAERQFDAELAAHPGDTRARYHLAFALLTQQKTEQAIPLLRQVIQENPKYAEAHYSLGKALLERGNLPEAIEYLEIAVRLDPAKPYSHYQLARAYLRAGRREEAQQEFQTTQNLKDQQRSKVPPGKQPETP